MLEASVQLKADTARRIATAMLERLGGAVMRFDGSREAVVLLDLLRNMNVSAIWIDTGAGLPEVNAFIERALLTLPEERRARVMVELPDYIDQHGFPSRLVPAHMTPMGTCASRLSNEQLRFTDWVSCCWANRFRPLLSVAGDRGCSLVFDVQRALEGFAPHNSLVVGISFENLLWDWADEDLASYVSERGLDLAPTYVAGCADPVTCWGCTAQIKPSRLEYIRSVHPDRWRILKPMISQTLQPAVDELMRWSDCVPLISETVPSQQGQAFATEQSTQ